MGASLSTLLKIPKVTPKDPITHDLSDSLLEKIHGNNTLFIVSVRPYLTKFYCQVQEVCMA
jgi:hypothetical protein